jgi:hypothetical protein
MARKNTKAKNGGKKVTRYTYDDVKEPWTPETGHAPLLPSDASPDDTYRRRRR